MSLKEITKKQNEFSNTKVWRMKIRKSMSQLVIIKYIEKDVYRFYVPLQKEIVK